MFLKTLFFEKRLRVMSVRLLESLKTCWHFITLLSNDSFYQPSPHGTYRQRYYDQEIPGQFIYYDDGYGNEYPSAPDEISF